MGQPQNSGLLTAFRLLLFPLQKYLFGGESLPVSLTKPSRPAIGNR